ncbi:MAG: SIR2 family NAD-dependent protein deacylase [Terriglobia bacterium]
MNEDDWKVLLGRIQDGKVTPFLGAGVNYRVLPLGGQIAREWAEAEHFPLRSSDDLATVAQFIAVKYEDPMRPKEEILKRIGRESRPDFSQPDDRLTCLTALAGLPLPVYLTTNYDDLMVEALRHADPKKNPRREVCRWHAGLKALPSIFAAGARYQPDHANPVVYHLHGSDQYVESLVLTEDDYLDFLVNVSRNQKILPARIQQALTDASLLFVGYRLKDINFRVIYRGLVQGMEGSLRRLSVTVQMTPPEDHAGNPEAAEKFMNDYYKELKVKVFWGTAAQFAQELRDRWKGFCEGNAASQ